MGNFWVGQNTEVERRLTPKTSALIDVVLIKEGAVKLLVQESPWNPATWTDSHLKLYSDATIEHKINNDWHKIRLGPYGSAHVSGNNVVYSQVFDVSGDIRPTSFAASTVEEAEQWICTINFLNLKKNLTLLHPHPLTSRLVVESKQGPSCIGCQNSMLYGQVHECEFCQNFHLCHRCHLLLEHVSATIVKSPNHPHELFHFAAAKNEHGNPRYFARGYNGKFICNKCRKECTGQVYHCGECGNYDECEDCCAEYAKVTVPQRKINARRFIADHLSAQRSMKISGNTYQLIRGPKLCPLQSSIVAENYWDLEKIEAEPVPQAYFEVTFHNINEQSEVSIGIGNQIFTPTRMLGHQQNSFGYFNDGKITQNENNTYNFMPGFKSGDTVGAGILLDSFSQRRLNFTKNGQIIGTFPERVHKGMDCFPGVSFTRDSQVWFTINNEGPFLFNTNSVPDFRNDKTTYIAQLPDELVASCLSFVAERASQVLEIRLVSKKFSQQVYGNEIWQPLFMKRWSLQNPKLKAKSWFKMYKARAAALREGGGFSPIVQSTIENCEFEFQCPILWESLYKPGSNENERVCDKCEKTVYEVHDEATLRDYAAKGRCVSLVQKYMPPLMGMPAQRIFVPPPNPEPIGGPQMPMPPGYLDNFNFNA